MNEIKLEKYSNKEIAHLLRSVAAVYLLTGGNRFKQIAYENAAGTIEQLSREVKDIWQDGRLTEIPGIGSSIASSLDDYFKTGKSKHFESILSKVPSTVFILMKIPSIGPKKAYKLVRAFNLENENTVIQDLKNLCLQGKVAELETFGKKSEQDIFESIKLFQQRSAKTQRMAFPYASAIAQAIISYLRKNNLVKRADALGSLRRMVSTIGDIDIAVLVKSAKLKVKSYKEIIDYFINYPKKIRVDNAGEKKASIIVHPNIRVDMRVQDERSYGSMLQYFTGSKSHNIKLREFALKKGLSLSEYGIKPLKEVRRRKLEVGRYKNKLNLFEFKDEKDFYNFLDLQYIPPEIREGTNEIDLASRQGIPELVELKDIKGDLHIHSSYDLKPSHDLGENSYREILEYADKLGYEYIGFADHNPKISSNSENQIIEIMKRRKENIQSIFERDSSTPKITARNDRGVNCFIGLETDILPDGRIALPEKAIDYVDYLIVSVHSVFNLDINSMTKRVLKALSYPKVKILGHPTGRLLGKREGYELDWNKVFDFCSKKNIALEINSWPDRLDLPDSLVRKGLKYGIKYTINTDAHANTEMDGMFYGVGVAKRGWCRKNDIINSLPYENIKKWMEVIT